MNLHATALRDRGASCVSDLQLDQLLAADLSGGPDENHIRHHLEECDRCRARLASFQGVAPVVPNAATLGRADTPVRRRLVVGAIGAVTALAAAAGVALVLSQRPAGLRRRASAASTGGAAASGGLSLEIQVKRQSGAIARVDPSQGDAVRPGQEMRFAVSTARPGYATVLGLDAFPSVTVYVPAEPDAPAAHIEAPADKLLLGAVIADETLGLGRIFAVVCPTAMAPSTVRERARAALAATHGRPEAVTSLGTGCEETSVLVRKEASPAR